MLKCNVKHLLLVKYVKKKWEHFKISHKIQNFQPLCADWKIWQQVFPEWHDNNPLDMHLGQTLNLPQFLSFPLAPRDLVCLSLAQGLTDLREWFPRSHLPLQQINTLMASMICKEILKLDLSNLHIKSWSPLDYCKSSIDHSMADKSGTLHVCTFQPQFSVYRNLHPNSSGNPGIK